MTTFEQGQRIGPFRIVKLLGEGGMGAVYEARREPIDLPVALKILHPHVAKERSAVLRFFNEARALSQLQHPSIVHLSDFGFTEDGTSYMALELLVGHTLCNLIASQKAKNKGIPLLNILQLSLQIADVLSLCHSRGIVHRDLKPENIMIVNDPVAPTKERIKVLDFGIVKFMSSQDQKSPKTATKEILGTPMYMSPEQVSGTGGIDSKTDVYSLGCVLFEMVELTPPFKADENWQFIGMHLFQTPPSLTARFYPIPNKLRRLVSSMLSKEKSDRPSMDNVRSQIADCLTANSIWSSEDYRGHHERNQSTGVQIAGLSQALEISKLAMINWNRNIKRIATTTGMLLTTLMVNDKEATAISAVSILEAPAALSGSSSRPDNLRLFPIKPSVDEFNLRLGTSPNDNMSVNHGAAQAKVPSRPPIQTGAVTQHSRTPVPVSINRPAPRSDSLRPRASKKTVLEKTPTSASYRREPADAGHDKSQYLDPLPLNMDL